jgi:peptidoglycan hydrolase CwlO-like protein
MKDRIKELLNTLEQELTNGLNNLPEYQGTLDSLDLEISEGRTFINGAQCTLNELKKELEKEKNYG